MCKQCPNTRNNTISGVRNKKWRHVVQTFHNSRDETEDSALGDIQGSIKDENKDVQLRNTAIVQPNSFRNMTKTQRKLMKHQEKNKEVPSHFQ